MSGFTEKQYLEASKKIIQDFFFNNRKNGDAKITCEIPQLDYKFCIRELDCQNQAYQITNYSEGLIQDVEFTNIDTICYRLVRAQDFYEAFVTYNDLPEKFSLNESFKKEITVLYSSLENKKIFFQIKKIKNGLFL